MIGGVDGNTACLPLLVVIRVRIWIRSARCGVLLGVITGGIRSNFEGQLFCTEWNYTHNGLYFLEMNALVLT